MRKLIAGFKISADGKFEGPEGFAEWGGRVVGGLWPDATDRCMRAGRPHVPRAGAAAARGAPLLAQLSGRAAHHEVDRQLPFGGFVRHPQRVEQMRRRV